MELYSLNFKTSAEKDLRRLPKAIIGRVMEVIEGLQLEPFPRKAIKLSGTERLYRIPVGDYRIVYEVNTQNQKLTVYYIRHRREVYRRI
ncbi:type II toxin-antitoxin system RelE family toxin [Neomoorella glycerini]|uniref:type II toxin-antitoxin system RelE family toxin n=1 Tax=Neomoorella glycerini TaxID=55779 RepID=UPI0012E2D950